MNQTQKKSLELMDELLSTMDGETFLKEYNELEKNIGPTVVEFMDMLAVSREGTIKRLHVNQHNIKFNAKNEEQKPVLTIKTSKRNVKCNRVLIDGPSELVYSADKPLACGAKVWIETTSKLTIID